MKKRFLPIGLFSILLFVFSAFLLAPDNDNNGNPEDTIGQQVVQNVQDYLAKIRNNQHTGLLNPADVLNARQQMTGRMNYKSGNSGDEMNWIEMGPDNVGGRVRAVIFDNRDANAMTLYAGGTSGGIFKSTNAGNSWAPVNSSGQNLNVTSMVQDAAGTIYVGTGEAFSITNPNYSSFGQPGLNYEGGFIGQGIFKSDGNDNFSLVPGTEPVVTGDVTEWAYINKLALDPIGNRLFAATQTGLKYSGLSGLNNWQSECKFSVDSTIISRYITADSIIVCDSFKIIDGEYEVYGKTSMEYTKIDDTTNINTTYSDYAAFASPISCQDVLVSNNGWIIASFNGFIYVSETGDPGKFVNKSIYPNNFDSKRKDLVDYSTHVVFRNKTGGVIHDSLVVYSKEYTWHTDYKEFNAANSTLDEYPSSANNGRVSIAIAPSDQNIVYLMAAKPATAAFGNSLFNIYLSENKGLSWRIIAPGGSPQLNILGSYWINDAGTQTSFYQGDYSNTLAVSPNNPYKVLAGGLNMWEGNKVSETGYFQWSEKSFGRVISSSGTVLLFNGIFNPFYVHYNHHQYVYKPGTSNQFVIATDGGLYGGYYDGTYYGFVSLNNNLNITQFYSLDITGEIGEFVGGTHNNGTQYVTGKGSTPLKGEDIWRPLGYDSKYPVGTDGGGVALSTIRSTVYANNEEEDMLPPSFYSKDPWPEAEALNARIRRSETLGFDYSANLFQDASPTNTAFYTPIAYWESFSNMYSRDSVVFVADKQYNAGDKVTVISNNLDHPFTYTLPAAISEDESIKVQDIVSTKFFIATKDNIWMTMDGVRFDLNPDWFKISAKAQNGFKDNPSCIAYSSDANYLFVGNYEGKVYRISNIALAFTQELADVGSTSCIIATTELNVDEENTQAITSIAVNPNDANKVLITLGNYGNTNYVYYSTNALGDNPVFTPVQGSGETGLPQMPVYSSVLEMNPDSAVAIVGTEQGIWISDNIASGNWYPYNTGMGNVPVMSLKQQTIFKTSYTAYSNDPQTNAPIQETFSEIKNYGMIYAATYGRGVFRLEKYFTVGEDEIPASIPSSMMNIKIYPNPASDNIQVILDLDSNTDVQCSIYDLSGKMMLTNEFKDLNKGHQMISLNVNVLARGTYLMKVNTSGQSSSAKLVIVK